MTSIPIHDMPASSQDTPQADDTACFPLAVRRKQALALRASLHTARGKTLRPPPSLTLDAWADQYRFLPPESASEPGRWRTSRIEVARGPMRAVTAPGVREITVVAGTQIAKTELLLNACFYFAHLDPCPILLIQPSEHMANEFSKQRLSASIRVSPALRSVFAKSKGDSDPTDHDRGPSKAKDSSNTLLSKTFPGGMLAIASASSPSQLASRPIRIVIADEIDRYEASAGGEGDPLGIAEKRTGNFPSNSLKMRVSSPTDAPSGNNPGSRIYASYRASDQRRPYVPCPHCGHMQVLTMGAKDSAGGIKWPSGRPEQASYFCGECGAAWTDAERLTAIQSVEWRQTRTFTCCGIEQEPQEWDWSPSQYCALARCTSCNSNPVLVRHAGFLMSRLYSPFQTLADVALEFVEVHRSKNHNRLKQFINTVLCELWEEPAEIMSGVDMLARREVYPAEVPDGVLALFAGIDTQDGRLECTVLGVGRDEELFVIDHAQFFGDTGEPEVWGMLDAHLSRRWMRRDGVAFVVQSAAIDTGGHRTQTVYDFCQKRVARRIWAIRGKADSGGRRSPIWPTKPTLKSRGRVPLYEVGTASAKFLIRSCLGIARPGPRYLHFPDTCTPQYFEQLQAERIVTRFKNGVSYTEFICPDGKRNETLDCMVYALGAYYGMVQAGFKPHAHAVPMGVDAPPIITTEPPDTPAKGSAPPPVSIEKHMPAPPGDRKPVAVARKVNSWLQKPRGDWFAR